jgi:hypothetical protein
MLYVIPAIVVHQSEVIIPSRNMISTLEQKSLAMIVTMRMESAAPREAIQQITATLSILK